MLLCMGSRAVVTLSITFFTALRHDMHDLFNGATYVSPARGGADDVRPSALAREAAAAPLSAPGAMVWA